MKDLWLISLVSLLIFCPDLAISAEGKGQTYTAYNLWFESPEKMWCINFKQGEMIPAGTEVEDVDLVEKSVTDGQGRLEDTIRYIEFKRKADQKSFKISFESRYHPGKKIRDYYKGLFSKKSFEQMTAGLSEGEVYAIRRGVLLPGMSKAAVLIGYGPPPEHHTPDLGNQIWHYWIQRNLRKDIYFDEDGRTMPVL